MPTSHHKSSHKHASNSSHSPTGSALKESVKRSSHVRTVTTSRNPTSTLEDNNTEYPEELALFSEEVMSRLRDPATSVLAVVKTEHREPLRELIDRLKSKEKLSKKGGHSSTIVVVSPKTIQNGIQLLPSPGEHDNRNPATLYVLVNRGIESISYRISADIRRVYIETCGQPTETRYTLCINSDSTYCDYPTYAWANRPEGAVPVDRRITHEEGCYFDLRNMNPRDMEKYTVPAGDGGGMTPEALNEILQEAERFRNERMMDGHGEPSPRDDWFDRWKLFIASVMGVAAGLRSTIAAGIIYCNAAGFFVQGPFGFKLAAGCFNTIGFGGVCAGAVASGVAVGIAAGALVYFVPWDYIFNTIKDTLGEIWEVIKDVFAWAWEKLKELTSAVTSWVTQLGSYTRAPMEFTA